MWCNAHDENEMNTRSFYQNLKRKDHLNHVHMNWNSLTHWLTGFCETFDDSSGSINMGNYIKRRVIINISVKTICQEVRYFISYFSLFCLCRCVNPMVTIATVLTNDAEIFQGGLSVKESIRTVKKSFHPSSDHVSIAWLYHEWETLCAEDAIDALIFSQEKGLNNEKMKLISSKK